MAEFLKGIEGFDWDRGNIGKNEGKHAVTDRETMEVFFNHPQWIAPSSRPAPEIRFVILGRTYGARLLSVIFTIRNKRVRVISGRPMSRKERETYEKAA